MSVGRPRPTSKGTRLGTRPEPEAIVFAAGLGTRLRPHTDATPKALIDVAGRPMLDHVLGRLRAIGVQRVVVNVHAFAAQIEAHVEAYERGGMEIVLSHEREAPLETGGGLEQARPLLRGRGPIVLHNVDVLSEIPLGALCAALTSADAEAVLAVSSRASTRGLLFDDVGLLGRVDDTREQRVERRAPSGRVVRRAFQGVHVIAPRFLRRLDRGGAYGILEPYLDGAAEGAALLPFQVGSYAWIDIGRPEHLEQARRRYGASGGD